MFAINIEKIWENVNDLASLQDQVKAVGLPDKLGEPKFHEDMKKIFVPVTKTIKNTCENKAKTITESSKNNNKAIENLNEKVLK